MADFPSELQHDVGGEPAAKIKILSLSRKSEVLTIKDQEVVLAESELSRRILERYSPPKIPVTHKGGESWMHDHRLWGEKRPFVLVDESTQHDHIV